jgi:hypothetical protein
MSRSHTYWSKMYFLQCAKVPDTLLNLYTTTLPGVGGGGDVTGTEMVTTL